MIKLSPFFKPMQGLGAGLATGLAASAILLCASQLPAAAADMHHHHATSSGAPKAFVASTAKPYAALVDDAMAVMSDGMQRAPMNHQPDHDFVTMMMPHHQGAIDMAKALLLYSTDPAMRNLAQGILTEQQNEINLMKAWLEQHPATLR